MEALRNHAQHSGLPVHSIIYNWLRVPAQGADYFQYTVIPQTRVKTLAANEKFKKTVLKELEALGESVDLRGAFLLCSSSHQAS